MLQYMPHTIGELIKNVDTGLEKIVYRDPVFNDAPEIIKLTSPAFKHNGTIPIDFTADGKAISPPLEWHGVPGEAWGLVLIVEDVDSPTVEPLTHAVVLGLPATNDQIEQGAFRNFGARYFPPDPPTGHGPHRYAFQVFALDRFFHPSLKPSKEAVKDAMNKHVIAKGCLVGIYERK